MKKTEALNIIVFVADSPLVGTVRGYNYIQIKRIIKDEFGDITPVDMRKKYPELEPYFQMADDFLLEHPKKAKSTETLDLENKILAKLKENSLNLVNVK